MAPDRLVWSGRFKSRRPTTSRRGRNCPSAFAFPGTFSEKGCSQRVVSIEAPGTKCALISRAKLELSPVRGHKGESHMSQETQRHEITKNKVVYQMPAAHAVTIRRDVEYRVTDAGALAMDIYHP